MGEFGLILLPEYPSTLIHFCKCTTQNTQALKTYGAARTNMGYFIGSVRIDRFCKLNRFGATRLGTSRPLRRYHRKAEPGPTTGQSQTDRQAVQRKPACAGQPPTA